MSLFVQYPDAPFCYKVGDCEFLAAHHGSAVDYAKRNGLEVVTVTNPKAVITLDEAAGFEDEFTEVEPVEAEPAEAELVEAEPAKVEPAEAVKKGKK